MNHEQEKFLQYILESVQEDKIEDAKLLLAESFKKQEEGTFTREDILQAIPKFMSFLKPEKVEEVQGIMAQFAKDFGF